ncbi:hypothetical protein HMPREF9176_2087 [Streptococcus downei F0415]|nr:hypothetical protein HMPREF9176_2087 [Streptococcus downei F0415]
MFGDKVKGRTLPAKSDPSPEMQKASNSYTLRKLKFSHG